MTRKLGLDLVGPWLPSKNSIRKEVCDLFEALVTVLSWSLLRLSLLFLVAMAMEVPSSGRVTDVLSVRVDRSVAASVILPAEVCKAEDSVGDGNGSLRTTSTPIVEMRTGFIIPC